MGMDSFVYAFRPPDKKWRQMKAVWDACEASGVDVPGKVASFFDGTPDDAGVKIALREGDGIVTKWDDDESAEGFQVDIPALLKRHPDVRFIRFENSW